MNPPQCCGPMCPIVMGIVLEDRRKAAKKAAGLDHHAHRLWLQAAGP